MRRTLCWRQRGSIPQLIKLILRWYIPLISDSHHCWALSCPTHKHHRSSVNHRPPIAHPGLAALSRPRVSPLAADVTGQARDRRHHEHFIFFSIKDACLQSSVMAGDGGWQLINNERIPFNLWPGSFPDRVCHTDFSLHLSHLTTLLPETKRSKSPERNVHIECLLQISEDWGWWNSFDMLIWAWNWGEIYDTKPRVCSPAAGTHRCALWHHWWVWLQVDSRVHRVLSGLLIHRLYFIFIWFWSSFFFVLCWIICCLF